MKSLYSTLCLLCLKPPIRLPAFFKRVINTGTILICSANITAYADTGQLNSKRIEVYPLSQTHWDTQYGDTLDNIVYHLLPNNPSKHNTLKQDIVHLNPQAFINNNPEQLLADKRLWMPGYMKQADSKADPATTIVESYSWGNIKRQKQ